MVAGASGGGQWAALRKGRAVAARVGRWPERRRQGPGSCGGGRGQKATAAGVAAVVGGATGRKANGEGRQGRREVEAGKQGRRKAGPSESKGRRTPNGPALSLVVGACMMAGGPTVWIHLTAEKVLEQVRREPRCGFQETRIKMPPPNVAQKYPHSSQIVMNDHVENEQEDPKVPKR
ncbi:uncharacterized protein LOC131874278 [Cryptomeria japonica]|uniref:uncharacterized protein LOC131874278 n=1 Tax=Cryptomeria japonica TaxID=3369 RepID=UPI0027D9E03F|nr:uncharacterized protein LOC131874278 [Cryptomeria japonica]